jgi:MFS family permease
MKREAGPATAAPRTATKRRSRLPFRRVWAAAAISNLGDGIALAALPLLVASQTHDPLLVGAAAAALQLPWLLFALPSGAIADRLDRRVAMISMDLVRVGVVGVLALLVLVGHAGVAVICAVSFALSSAETVFDPASEAIVPLVVEPEALAGANARLQGTSFALNSFIGPPIGAALFFLVAAAPFVFDAASFLASAAIVLTLAGSYRRPSGGPSQTMLAETADGLRWLAGHPVLRFTAPLAGVMNIAGYAILATLVLFSEQVLGLSDVGYGVLLAGFGLGGLIGAATAGIVIGRIGEAGAMRLAPFTQAAAMLLVIVVPEPVIAIVALAVAGSSVGLWNVAHVTLRQRLVPDELRGRVAGTNGLVTAGARPIGAALGTVAATLFGLTAPFVVATAILVAGGLVGLARITPAAVMSARKAGP